jgi:hypothetical protein
MKQVKTRIFTMSLALTAMVVPALTAHAAQVETFNSSLSAPGVYFGTGNSNSGFDVVTATNALTEGTLQLGLEAVNRHVGPITPTGNDYVYSPGPGTPSTLANWDFVYSVNTGSDSLLAYTYGLTITDVTKSKSVSFNPALVPDNAQANGSATCNATSSKPCTGFTYATDDGFQNSENLGFSFFSTPLGFDPNAADTYSITLSAVDATDPSVTIYLTPTTSAPEPSSLVLLGSGLLSGAGMLIRKRRTV